MPCTLAPPAADDDDRSWHPRPRSTSAPFTRPSGIGSSPPARCRHSTIGKSLTATKATRANGASSCRETRLALARVSIGKFVRRQASETAAAVGFGWEPTTDAPSTHQQLRGAYAESLTTGRPLPVSNLHTETSVFPKAEDNIAFRFWHDVHHVRLGLSFSLPDELELATWHLAQAEAAGFAPGSLAYRLLEADHVGQVLLQGLAQRFPFDQEAFTLTCAEVGLGIGLLAELRRVPGRSEHSQRIVTHGDADLLQSGGGSPDASDTTDRRS